MLTMRAFAAAASRRPVDSEASISMDTLQKLFNDALRSVVYEAAAELIAGKLAAHGMNLTTRERERLISHLKSNSSGSLTFRRWRWWDRRRVGIEITES